MAKHEWEPAVKVREDGNKYRQTEHTRRWPRMQLCPLCGDVVSNKAKRHIEISDQLYHRSCMKMKKER